MMTTALGFHSGAGFFDLFIEKIRTARRCTQFVEFQAGYGDGQCDIEQIESADFETHARILLPDCKEATLYRKGRHNVRV